MSTTSAPCFHALYLDSTYLTDAEERNALKMAARMVLEKDEKILKTACSVDVYVLPNSIKVVKRKPTSADCSSSILFEEPLQRVSGCFILREDNKVVSIGVTGGKQISQAHIFLLTSAPLANELVASIYKSFSASCDFSTPCSTQPIPATEERSMLNTSKVDPTQSNESACLVDLLS